MIDLIGRTPLVKINRLNPNPKVEIYAKLEGLNPGGSVKDRICLRMIEEAEKEGKLTRDKVILEPTSGDTEIGLAMIAAARGYRCLLVMPASVSLRRVLMLKAYGAEVILTPPERRTALHSRPSASTSGIRIPTSCPISSIIQLTRGPIMKPRGLRYGRTPMAG
ncbi:MAG: pyridoxal-phosphate dependent enzyme [Candidatus Korarchaeum sp.]